MLLRMLIAIVGNFSSDLAEKHVLHGRTNLLIDRRHDIRAPFPELSRFADIATVSLATI